MDKSLVRIKCTSPEIKLGDVSYNRDLIIKEIEQAEKEGVNVILFPELALCGYSLRDLLSSQVIVDACYSAVEAIIEKTIGLELTVLLGTPFSCNDKLYNAVVVISKGKVLGIVPKMSFVKKSPFGENRVFDVPDNAVMSICAFGKRTTIGADITFNVNGFRAGVVIGQSRENVDKLVGIGAKVIFNPTADILTVTSQEERRYTAKSISYQRECVFVMCNAGENESTTDALFSAHNLVCQNGAVMVESSGLKSKTGDAVCEINMALAKKGLKPVKKSYKKNSPYPFLLEDQEEMDERCGLILEIQSRALARRLLASYSKTMVIGISGGLDSTLAILAMVKSADYLGWDRKSIIAVTMPCFGTTKRTKSNAITLCEALGVTLKEIDISEATRIHLKDIGHSEENKNVTYENAQARERTQVLMDIANDTNGIVVGTGDLSESALGWCTYNGDHISMYAVNSDIPKTLVRYVVAFYAKNAEECVKTVLNDILDTPVSPELLPANSKGEIQQKTEDLVGPYDLHDYFLYNFVAFGYTPSKIYSLAIEAFEGKFDKDTIYKWLKVFLKRFVTQQFKRSCTPDGIKLCKASLSPRGDFNMPSDMSYQAFLDELDKNIK